MLAAQVWGDQEAPTKIPPPKKKTKKTTQTMNVLCALLAFASLIALLAYDTAHASDIVLAKEEANETTALVSFPPASPPFPTFSSMMPAGTEIWPTVGYGGGDGVVVVFGLVVHRTMWPCYMCPMNTSMTVLTSSGSDDPREWQQSTTIVPAPPHQFWFSGVVVHDEWTYVYGHCRHRTETFVGMNSPVIVRRHRLHRLLRHDWTHSEIWARGGRWEPDAVGYVDDDRFEPLGDMRMWENTIFQSSSTTWTTVSNHDIFSFQVWTAPQLVGPWTRVGDPMPVTAPHPNRLCYAMKYHAELSVFTYVCNVWDAHSEPRLHDLTGDPAQRLYWPRFVHVSISGSSSTSSLTVFNRTAALPTAALNTSLAPAADAQLVFDRLLPSDETHVGYLGGDCAASMRVRGDLYLWIFCDTYIGRYVDGRRTSHFMPWNTVALINVTSGWTRAFWGESGGPRCWASDFFLTGRGGREREVKCGRT